EDTDLGKGLVSELIRDSSGKISCSLKQYIIEEGLTDSVQTAIDDLCNFWQENRIASRKLLPHNVVAQQDASGNVKRLVVIDGLGDPNLIPLKWLPQTIGNRKVAKNIAEFQRRIRKLCDEVEAGKTFSSKIGKLLHDGTSQQSD
ncbi:MAG: YrbL family protein, partial [Ketobacteraceae bacterium]|nr:YrbL family protein [Ketobacteraceae bacterium]